VAIDYPNKVDIPTTTYSGANVVIDWNAPNDHSSPITQYEIAFRKSDGTFDNTLCDGTDATVKSTTSCSVNMITLKTATGLALDSLI
jgi:hypothetical protein